MPVGSISSQGSAGSVTVSSSGGKCRAVIVFGSVVVLVGWSVDPGDFVGVEGLSLLVVQPVIPIIPAVAIVWRARRRDVSEGQSGTINQTVTPNSFSIAGILVAISYMSTTVPLCRPPINAASISHPNMLIVLSS